VAIPWWPLIVFSLMALVTKFLSFRMMGVVTLSMDTAVYITAIVTLGAVPAAWTVFISMYLKIIWDTVDRELLSKTESRPFLENITTPLFQGGTGALVALLAAWFLPIDDFISGKYDRNVHVLWLASTLAALFVVFQYSIVLNKYYLRGYSWKNLFWKVFLPGFWAEMVLIPLAMVMTIVYHTHGHVSFPFIFLIATYIIVNFIFKKLSDATSRLDEKVKHLESLNELGRTICSTLMAGDLVPALAHQTLSVVGKADAALVLVRNDEDGTLESHIELREGFAESRFDRETGTGLASWVIANNTPFSTQRLGTGQEGIHLTELKGRPLGPHSWMGIPIRVYEETIGVLVLHAEATNAFAYSDVGLFQMIGQQAAVALENSRLYVLATVDGLTRLFVRRYFDRRLAEEVARARRYGTSFSLMLVDFDDFKEINDSYGHAVGDLVLRRVADIVLTEVRTIDIPARYGGDEFAIVLPEVNWRGAMTLAQRILHRVRRETVRSGDNLITSTLSIGLASFPEHASDSPAQIIAAADKAMYAAKHGGKDRISVFGEE